MRKETDYSCISLISRSYILLLVHLNETNLDTSISLDVSNLELRSLKIKLSILLLQLNLRRGQPRGANPIESLLLSDLGSKALDELLKARYPVEALDGSLDCFKALVNSFLLAS